MSRPYRARLRTVAARGLWDGRRGVPEPVRIAGVRDFRKGVLALGRRCRGLTALAAT